MNKVVSRSFSLIASGLLTLSVAAAAQFSGSVSQSGGKYFLTDPSSQMKIELRGTGLKKYIGKTVQVNGQFADGAKPAGDATQVVTVSDVNGVGAGTTTAKATAAGVKAGGLSKGAILGLTTVGAAGGTVGGLYASGAIGGDDQPASRR